jgi:hypothetical protein
MPVRRVVAAAAAACLLTACGSGSSSTAPSDSGSDSPSGAVASPPHTIAPSPQTPLPSGSPSGGTVGSADHPVAVEPEQALLDWHPVPGSTKDVVTAGDRWTLTVTSGGHSARLDGPHPRTIRAGAHASITDALLDGAHALVVSEDRLAEDPDVATVVDLRTGQATTLDRSSSPPTVVGGTWALGPETVVHATSGPHRSYCVATVDLTTGQGSTGWCAEPRHGFSRAAVSGRTTTMMTFDDHRPSCRSLGQVSGADVTPLPGVTPCKGWDSALTGSGAVWSVVPKERRIEAAHFYAHTAAGWYDLGPGTSGSLVTCGSSSYFTRDPGSRTDPATLMRWSPDDAELSVVYASKGTGNAFLSPPRCGGARLTVTSFSQAGDEQVTTPIG